MNRKEFITGLTACFITSSVHRTADGGEKGENGDGITRKTVLTFENGDYVETVRGMRGCDGIEMIVAHSKIQSFCFFRNTDTEIDYGDYFIRSMAFDPTTFEPVGEGIRFAIKNNIPYSREYNRIGMRMIEYDINVSDAKTYRTRSYFIACGSSSDIGISWFDNLIDEDNLIDSAESFVRDRNTEFVIMETPTKTA